MNYHKINLLIFSFVLVFLFSLTSACAPDSKLVLPAAEQHTDNDIAEDDNLDTPETEIVSAPDTNISVPLGGDSETTIENTNETATDTVTVKESGEEANTGIQFKKNQRSNHKNSHKNNHYLKRLTLASAMTPKPAPALLLALTLTLALTLALVLSQFKKPVLLLMIVIQKKRCPVMVLRPTMTLPA